MVAGEPVEVHVRFEDELEAPVAIIKSFVAEVFTIIGGAEGKQINYITRAPVKVCHRS